MGNDMSATTPDEHTEKNKHAAALSALGASKGGKARAESLSPAERTEIARSAALMRWAEGKPPHVPRAICGDETKPLKIGEIEIPCYVLDDERRVIVQRGMQTSIGMSRSGGKGGARRLVQFITSFEAKGVETKGLSARANAPIEFVMPNGGKAIGYEATMLHEICDMVLEARRHRKLLERQQHIAIQAEVLVRAFAKVGIIALVDEVTGYQSIRARDSLAKILEAFIAKELRPWVRTFPADFYREMFRLKNWVFDEKAPCKPAIVGRMTNEVIYSRLAPGVLDELRRISPRDDRGRLKSHYHRRLTSDIGHPKLKEHLAAVVTLMKVSKTWEQFLRFLDHTHPKYDGAIGLPFKD